MDAWTVKEEIAAFARRLYQLGMTNLFEGNISVYTDQVLFMTPSQQDKASMSAEQILMMDLEGNLLEPSAYRPSSEWKMHREIYRLRKDAGAVVHHHAVFATAFAMAGREIDTRNIPEAALITGNIPVSDYGRPSTEAVYRDFHRYFLEERRNVLLLGNHGLVSTGEDLKHAFAYAEEAEKIAKLHWLTLSLGGYRPLPEGEADALEAYAASARNQCASR